MTPIFDVIDPVTPVAAGATVRWELPVGPYAYRNLSIVLGGTVGDPAAVALVTDWVAATANAIRLKVNNRQVRVQSGRAAQALRQVLTGGLFKEVLSRAFIGGTITNAAAVTAGAGRIIHIPFAIPTFKGANLSRAGIAQAQQAGIVLPSEGEGMRLGTQDIQSLILEIDVAADVTTPTAVLTAEYVPVYEPAGAMLGVRQSAIPAGAAITDGQITLPGGNFALAHIIFDGGANLTGVKCKAGSTEYADLLTANANGLMDSDYNQGPAAILITSATPAWVRFGLIDFLNAKTLADALPMVSPLGIPRQDVFALASTSGAATGNAVQTYYGVIGMASEI